MILTPLQLFAIIALIILVSVTAAWLISMHVRDTLETRFDDLQHRLDRRDTTITVDANGIHGSPDALSAWEDIINTTRKGQQL